MNVGNKVESGHGSATMNRAPRPKTAPRQVGGRGAPGRRVRDEVKAGVAVAAASVAASLAVTLVATLLVKLAG
jgi:hypothetical protein